jgi:hypothetical protein
LAWLWIPAAINLYEPASMVTLGAILVLSAGLDFGWKRVRAGRTGHVQVGH